MTAPKMGHHRAARSPARAIGYLGRMCALFAGSLRENLTLNLLERGRWTV